MTISDRIYHKSNAPENPNGHKKPPGHWNGQKQPPGSQNGTTTSPGLDTRTATKSLPETGTAGKISTERNDLLNETIRNSIGCKEIILDTGTAITCFVDAEFLES